MNMKKIIISVTCFLTLLFSFCVDFVSCGNSNLDVIAEKFRSEEKRNIIAGVIIDNILNIYAPVSDSFDNDLCRNHSQLYKEGVQSGQLWAVQMFDSSSKIPDGVLMGHLVDFGNFDECVQIKDVKSEFGDFSGQHCMVTIGSGESETRNMETFLQRAHPKKEQTSAGIGSSLSLKWSVCIPSSCRPHDLELHLQSTLPGVVGQAAIHVNDLRCNTAEQPEFRAVDWFAVGFMSFFAILVILSTTYDLYYTHSESRHSLLLAFSVYSNGNKLLNAPASSDSLPALHGVRFWSMMWVVLGHRYLYYVITPSINPVVVVNYLTDWKHMFVTNATLSVDSFFLLSGTLVCYIFLKEMERGTKFNVPLYYLHRYVRLTPSFAVMILLSATLLNYMDDGPLWRTNLEYAKNNCADNWWTGLLYINNYVNADHQCLGQSWYLAVDMQLFWISPLILYPLWRWPKLGQGILIASIISGLLIAFLVPFINEFQYTILDVGVASTMQYLPTHTRFTPWLIGIGLGYILHHTKKTDLRLTRVSVTIGWLLSAGLLLTSWLLAHHFTQPGHVYERFFESLYTCLMRPAWALGLAWVLFACIKGYGGFVNTFLSWSFFQVMGRLTYTVYLTHFSIMAWFNASTRIPGYINDRIIFTQYFGDLMFTFVAAFVLSIVFESPFIIIENYLLSVFVGRRKEPSNNLPKNDLETNRSNENLNAQEDQSRIEGGINGFSVSKEKLFLNEGESLQIGVQNDGFVDES